MLFTRFMRADSVFASPSQSGGGTLSSNPLLAIAVQLETAVKVAAVEGGSGGGEGRHSVNGDSLDDGAKAEGLGHEGGVMETSDDSCSTGLCLPRVRTQAKYVQNLFRNRQPKCH